MVWGRAKVKINRSPAASTTDGPEFVLADADRSNPPKTARPAVRAERTAMRSGVDERRCAATAGINSKAVISSNPTIFMEIAVTSARSRMKPSSARLT